MRTMPYNTFTAKSVVLGHSDERSVSGEDLIVTTQV